MTAFHNTHGDIMPNLKLSKVALIVERNLSRCMGAKPVAVDIFTLPQSMSQIAKAF